LEESARVIYNIPFVIPIGYLIAIYFYITGLHMGFYTTSVVATLLDKQEWKPIGKIGAVGALIVLAVAPVFLLVDLTQIARFWHLFPYINLRSPVTWGTFFLTAYPPIGLIYAWYVFRKNYRAAKIWGLCGFPVAVSVHGYTGFILALGAGRAFWNTALNPILFLVSAMVSGLALMIIIINIRYYYFAQNEAPEQKAADMGIIHTLVRMMYLFNHRVVSDGVRPCRVGQLQSGRVRDLPIAHTGELGSFVFRSRTHDGRHHSFNLAFH
jgi:tetrathionate reductase subunit C